MVITWGSSSELMESHIFSMSTALALHAMFESCRTLRKVRHELFRNSQLDIPSGANVRSKASSYSGTARLLERESCCCCQKALLTLAGSSKHPPNTVPPQLLLARMDKPDILSEPEYFCVCQRSHACCLLITSSA